ncbi:MAG: CCA tRNA nucleotidyltransferase [Anaerobacillus sp.]
MIRLKGKAYECCMDVLQVLTTAGYEAYIVGGAVRDALLGLPVSDFDIATSAKPEEVLELFEKVIPTGIKHGTVTVNLQGESFEITTFRSELNYADFRHPSAVSYLASVEGDLSRRDFTINSMALSVKGDLIDLHGGQEDLKLRVIRTVGESTERFQEDALRMLRALRFLSVLDFSLEKKTKESLAKQAHLLRHVAVERLQIEFNKLMAGQAVNSALNQLIQSGVQHYLPGLDLLQSPIEENTRLTMFESDIERWAWLATNTTDPISFLKEWRLSNRVVKQVERLISITNEVKSNGWNNLTVYDAYPGARPCERLLAVSEQRNPDYSEIDRITSELVITTKEMLVVTGADLISWEHSQPGPWVGEALRQIEIAVVTEKIKNEKSSIRRWLKQWRTQ